MNGDIIIPNVNTSKNEILTRAMTFINNDDDCSKLGQEIIDQLASLMDPKPKGKTLYEFWLNNNLPVELHVATVLLFQAYKEGASGHTSKLIEAFPDYFVDEWTVKMK